MKKHDELGPDNAEARDLISALHHFIDFGKDETEIDPDKDHDNTGVGKDRISKYAYGNVKLKNTEYFIQVRDNSRVVSNYLDSARADYSPQQQKAVN